MKFHLLITVALLPVTNVFVLTGQIGIHDHCTVIECDGKYYAFGTGGGGLISDDGWTWRGGAVRPGGGVAPDAIRIGDRYLVAYAAGGGNTGGVHTMWTKSLDANSPDFGYTDDTVIANGDLECNAIDPAFLLDANDKPLTNFTVTLKQP